MHLTDVDVCQQKTRALSAFGLLLCPLLTLVPITHPGTLRGCDCRPLLIRCGVLSAQGGAECAKGGGGGVERGEEEGG